MRVSIKVNIILLMGRNLSCRTHTGGWCSKL